ncbi:putative T7SS-secreted protein [Nocardia asteroides]|uniref:putative T7SS-secreted protein n=1 Tax=Nocardia asteroides TaxID=1824 RepID=UPI0037B11958
MGIGDFINDLGDKIEDGLESATEKVGQAYNTVLDVESKVAKAVGADGLSNFLDDLGDKIVDATGGAVPEKELGQTSDPKELVRGDVAKINEVTEHLGTIGTAINQTGDALRKIDVADWSGEAASAFHDEYSKQPKLWWDGADAMAKAKTALDAWSHEVTAAQNKASDAIAKWEAADREERDRKNEWNAKTDEQRDGKTLTDTWTSLREEAKAILTGARTQRDAAADTAAAAITAATDTAPTEPPFLSRWGSNFEDLSAAVEQAKLNFSSGLLTSLTGIVQFVRSISPIDAYNMTHPAEYMSKMSDLGTGMVLAAADPKATATAMLAGFKTNPSEALGALTGDVLTTVATGGAGGAAKFGASAVDKASDAARLGNAGRNVVDDAASAAGRHTPDTPGTTAPAQVQPAAHAPENPAAPATNPAAATPDAPATNPAAVTPDNPAGNPAGTTPEAPKSNLLGDGNPADNGPDAPSPETPRTPDQDPAAPPRDTSPENNPNAADNAPAGKPNPDPDGASPNPAAASPDGHSPDTPDNPPNRPDEDNSPGATAHDGAGPKTTDEPSTPGDPDNGTEPGARNGDDVPATPDNGTTPERLAHNDNGVNGEPGAGDTALKNGPEADADPGQTSRCQDPINVASGEFLLPLVDVDLPGILHLVLKRGHHSNYRFGRWFGPSWSATLDMRVVVEADCATVVFEDAMMLAYPHAEVGVGVEPITGGQRWKLTRTEVGGYRLWDPDRELVWHFAPERALDGLDTLLGNYAISAITDRHRNRVRFHYDNNGVPTEVTHSGGYRVIFESTGGRITAISVADTTDEVGSLTRVREFGYEHGDLTTTINGGGGLTRFTYDDQHRMLSWTDSNGSSVANIYDDTARVIAQRGTGGVYNADLEYLTLGDGTGRLTRVTNSRGAVTGWGFDTDLRLRDYLGADGGHRHYTYNSSRKPLTVREPDGATTGYRYTSDGDIETITRPDGSELSIDYAYPNRPATITNPDGTTYHREWDKAGNLVAATDPAGARTEYTHHASGAVATVRDPDGALTHIEVDSAGLPVCVTDPYGAKTSIVRDRFGRHIHITDALGNQTRYEWTPEGRPARRIDPDGYSESWTYDGENNLLTHTDRNGGTTRYTYGGFDQVATRTDPDGSTTQYLYDTERQLVAVVNPLGQRWTYEYDLAGRLAAETDYTGATTTYTHTTTGRLATTTPATGITRHHRYDLLGNLTSITADTGEYRAYTHDPEGRVLTAITGTDDTHTHTLAFTYTPTGQIATQKLDDQPALTNEHDHRGRRTRRTTPTGAVTTWHHNTINQVTAMHADGHDITFTHDRAGRLTAWRIGELHIERTLTPTGTLATQQVTAFPAEQFALDLGQPRATKPEPFTVRRDDFTYRADGFLTDHLSHTPTTTPVHSEYRVDELGRVTAITRDNAIAEAYEYDPLSNITTSYPANTGEHTGRSGNRREYHNNLLVRDGRNHYYYDPAGRLIRKVTTRISRKPDVWHYRYNAFDQLTDLYTPDGSWWRYTYDGQGRRCGKTQYLHDGETWRPGTHTDYTYDTHQPLEQSTSGHTERWHYLPDSHSPALVARNNYPGTAIVTDQAGAPIALIDPSTASMEATFASDLWGKFGANGEAAISLRLPGQVFDAESGLHYNLQRYYDPGTGRFLTSDPLGLLPSPNPHAYPDNPTRWIDPLGLAPDVTDCEMAGEPPAPGIVFRALSPGEDPALGLFARDPGRDDVTPLSHVAGKQNSPWISTTKLPEVAFGKYDGGNGVVAIDLSRVGSYTDISSGFPGKGRLDFYARKDQEVLVHQHVPPEAIIGFWQ